jgi:hypothetical protein
MNRVSERQRKAVVSSTQLLPSGYRSMNTKLVLSTIVAALMLTACAKQESAGTDTAATPPAPAAQPAAPADQSTPPANGTAAAPADAGAAAPAAGSTPPPEGSAPPATPPAEQPPPKQ